MMRDMLLSQQYFCAGTLLTLVFSMLLGNRRSPRSGALFCASMALLGAVVLQILKTYYEGAGFDIQIPAISAMCAGLTVLCAAALLTAFFLEYRKNGPFLWKELLIVCIPPWLYGLVSVLSKNAFQFTEALTLSLLLAWFLYLPFPHQPMSFPNGSKRSALDSLKSGAATSPSYSSAKKQKNSLPT